MNIHFDSNNKKVVENVTTRVKKTKQEIEQLKNELEKLINLGTQPPHPKPVLQLLQKPLEIFPQEKKKHVSQPDIPKKIEPPKKISETPETKIESKKTRNYDVNEARGYIKKQREKRAEQLKTQINVIDNKLDVKKQKLRELHQKTLELVTKNVQLKRERSKSRDREPVVRLDKSNTRHKSQENVSRAVPKPPERQKAAAPTLRAKSQDRAKSQERVKMNKPQILKDRSKDRAKSSERSKSQEKVKNLEKVTNRVSRPRHKPEATPALSMGAPKVASPFLPPEVILSPKNPPEMDLKRTVLPPTQSVVDLNKRTGEPSSLDLNKRITSEPSLSLREDSKSKKRVLRAEKPKSIMVDACLRDSKETQTNRNEGWVQPPGLPYPYNFINTVKRKLQYAINSPRHFVDVGVQNSRGDDPVKTPDLQVKSKEEIKELLIKSTSILNKNLDLKPIENLELVKTHRDIVSKNLFSGYESESDTSKNIPEISSESLGTLDSKPRLSLEKVKDLRLEKNPKEIKSKSDTDRYPEREVSYSYSSNFQKESVGNIRNKSGEKSESSTIRTVTNSLDLPKGDVTNQNTSKDSKILSYSNRSKTKEISSDLSNSSDSSTNKNSLSTSKNSQNYIDVINRNPRGDADSQRTFKSLLTEGRLSKTLESSLEYSKPVPESLALKEPPASLIVNIDKMNTFTLRTSSSLQNLEDTSQKTFLTEDKLSKSTKSKESTLADLKQPTVSLMLKEPKRDAVKSQMKNITLRPVLSTNNNVNEIHLKFEAEVRLLNDFNESFKQFMAVEKAYEILKNKNETNSKVLQNVDTQTSVITRTSTNVSSDKSARNSVNFSRGSEIIEELDDSVVNNNGNNISKSFSTDWNLSNLNESSNTNLSMGDEGKSRLSVSSMENCNLKNCASILSLNIFDQLIKDEDTRIQQLKAIIKIREQALLDRTKGELVWLEIQKKQLIETGRIEEASLLKKKQRGIIVKHEQERNEIKKLKQMQNEASEKRKNTLKQQRNLIKNQLSTENMLSKITVKKRKEKERRSTGPLRVVQSRSESICSETSISIRSSVGLEDVLSVTSRSVRISEESEMEEEKVAKARSTLLMREAALQKRRKAAEELLRWHRKLLDEERKIGELEAAAAAVATATTTTTTTARARDDKVYVMSQLALERLCKKHAKNRRASPAKSSEDYSSAFEKEEEKTKISSISELIDNFSRIEDEISSLSKKSEDIVSLKGDEETRLDEEIEISSIKGESVVEESKRKEEMEDTGEKTDEVEEISVKNLTTIHEDLERTESSIEEQKVPTDEQFEEQSESVRPIEEEKKEDAEEAISSLEEQNIVADEEILSKREDLEELSSKKVLTSEQVSEISEDLDEEPEEKSPDEITSKEFVEFEDKESEDLEVKTPEIISKESTESEDKEAISEDQEAVSEEITTKNEDSEKSHLPSSSEDPEEAKSLSSLSIEEREPSSISRSSGKEEYSIETFSKDSVRKSLDLEEALESAFNIEESLSKFNEKLSSEKKDEEISEEASTPKETESSEETPTKSTSKSEISVSETDETTPQKKNSNQIDVKKRVSEILADASLSRGDKSPRLQDLYVTAYDVGGVTNSSEFNESLEEGRQMPTDIFGSEAEELWRKQLAIEQEIKQIELQQKEQLPYMYMREIPNKPPPPYTPPSSLSSVPQSVLPTDIKEINEIASYSSKVLYKAYQNNNLDKVKFSENGFKLFSKIEVTKSCAEFVFNICKDIAKDKYRRFDKVEESSSWLISAKKPQLAKSEPPGSEGLEKILNLKLKELFGFRKAQIAESAIITWGRKKRDHVDEVLVIESQEEESQWTNFDKDELIMKNHVTEDIMKMLLEETASVYAKILKKKCVGV